MVVKTEVGKCELCGETAACVEDGDKFICLKCQKEGVPEPQPEQANPPAKPTNGSGKETAIATRTIEAGNRGLALRSIDDIYRFAQCVVRSGLAPSSYTTPEQIIIAVQTGAEMGMPPMRSLQSFCVINGAARMFGDAPLAKVRESKQLEYIKEHIEGEGDDRIAVCETKRKDDPNPKITKFSVADAKLAGLWGKVGRTGKPTPWVLYPERMLTYRARSFNLRDNFPDALAGATIAEEYEGVEMNGFSIPDAKPKSAALLEEGSDVVST